MSNEELKNCAHCNGKTYIEIANNKNNFYEMGRVICQKCRITTMYFEDINEAIKIWNKRA